MVNFALQLCIVFTFDGKEFLALATLHVSLANLWNVLNQILSDVKYKEAIILMVFLIQNYSDKGMNINGFNYGIEYSNKSYFWSIQRNNISLI